MADDDREIADLPLAGSFTGASVLTGLHGGLNVRFNGDQVRSYSSPSFVSPADYGLIADGTSHPLSERYASLGAAQVDYPFATALTQQIDYCACKQASNVALGADGVEHGSILSYLNKMLLLPQGSYWFGADTWLIRNLMGATIKGAGELATILKGNVAPLAFDGIWYTELADFSVQLTAVVATGALELDGNIVGHPYATRGVQAVTLRNMLIDGGGSTYALTTCRQGGSGAQGSECTFDKIHLSNASFALYYQNGFNALANKFIGGNFQNYLENGMYVVGGTIAVFDTGFQCAQGYRQIENDGFDINVGDAGAYEACVIYGCRTESLRFLRNAGAVRTDVRGCVGVVAVPGWFASQPYGAAAVLYKAIVEGGRLFVATTEGTSGSGAKPNFAGVATGGTIADNTIVWTETPFNFIDIAGGAGSLDYGTIASSAGSISAPAKRRQAYTNTSITLTIFDDTAIVNASAGAVTVTMPQVTTSNYGKQITIKKIDTSANAVTIECYPRTVEGGGTQYTIAGGSRGSKTIEWSTDATIGDVWLIMAQV